MNVSLQNTDQAAALLTVKIEKQDYQPKVEKALKNYCQKAQLPGFRPGNVPMGLIKKQVGKSILIDEVNKLLQDAVYNYISENNVAMLGEPMPNAEKQASIDFDTQEEFEFVMDIALAPEITLTIDADDVIDYYDIAISDEMVEGQIKSYKQRAGKYTQVEDYQDRDMVKGTLTELDENGNIKEGGKVIEDASLMPYYMNDEEQKARFLVAKPNAEIVFNPNVAYNGNEAELSSLLKIEKAEVAEMKSDFRLTITEITRFVEGELTQDFYDQLFGQGVVTSDEECRAKTRENLKAQYVTDSDYKLIEDVRNYCKQKVGKLTYADELLRKFLANNKAEKGEKLTDEEYEQSIDSLTWTLIESKLVKDFNIKVEKDDLLAAAKESVQMQFAQYGMVNIPEDMLTEYASKMLDKKESAENLAQYAITKKLVLAIKNVVKLNIKNITVEEFNQIVQA